MNWEDTKKRKRIVTPNFDKRRYSVPRPQLALSQYLRLYTISMPVPLIWCDMHGNVREIPNVQQPEINWEQDLYQLEREAFRLNMDKYPKEALSYFTDVM